MARASWKGEMVLGKVAIPVEMFVAQSDREKISFHLLNAKTGNRLRQRMVDEETGKPVERGDQVKGVEIARNRHIIVTDAELDDIRIESTHRLCLERFVPQDQVPAPFQEGSHYLAPGDGEEAQGFFALLRDLLATKGLAGIGRVVLSTRERLVMVTPRPPGMLVTTLRWAQAVRKADDAFASLPDVDFDAEMLELAGHVISRKQGKLDFAACDDRYEDALADLIRAKQQGKAPKPRKFKAPEPVSDLKKALRDSLGGTATKRKAG
ncbi:Ku protein [Niveispirillum irakense]|uniref:non-homologous end joining protein Ku n=1 Tax=Niveispirillum irakense TaxID=34011 RepID=UPI00040DDBAE|nr:Ku protein [Niveispirillum irakense]